MARRRAKGEGSIEKLPSGRFRAVVTTGRDASTGKQQKASRTFATEREARGWKDDHKKDQNGEWGRKPLSAWLDHWLTIKEAEVERTTLDWYSQRIRRYVKPLLGRKVLGELKAIDVRGMLSEMAKGGATQGEQRRAMKTLRAALQTAHDLDQVGGNQAKKVKMPKAPPAAKVMSCLDQDQVRTLLRAASGDPYEAYCYLALDTGCRPGELFGLHWPDVEEGSVFVRQSVEYFKGAVRLKEPKTRAGRRRILISPRTVEVLRSHRGRSESAGLDVRRGPVFTDGEGGLIRGPNFRQRFFVPLLRRADLPAIRLYDLRHTSATLLLAAEVNLKVVSQRLGHEDVAITLRHYVHAMPSMQEKAVSAVQAIFNPTVIPREEEDKRRNAK